MRITKSVVGFEIESVRLVILCIYPYWLHDFSLYIK